MIVGVAEEAKEESVMAFRAENRKEFSYEQGEKKVARTGEIPNEFLRVRRVCVACVNKMT